MKDIYGKDLIENCEYVINCDSSGKIIGPIEKRYAHSKEIRPVLIHYGTWAMVYNPRIKKYGIQLKHPKLHDKIKTPRWDIGVGGHNCYLKVKEKFVPLSFEETLVKETKEEIGLKLKVVNSVKELLKMSKKLKGSIGYILEQFHRKTDIDNQWIGFGIILTTEKDLEFEDGEVLEFRWLSPEELKDFLKKCDDYYSPLPLAFGKAEKFRREYLV